MKWLFIACVILLGIGYSISAGRSHFVQDEGFVEQRLDVFTNKLGVEWKEIYKHFTGWTSGAVQVRALRIRVAKESLCAKACPQHVKLK
jgi:hypothetical protein